MISLLYYEYLVFPNFCLYLGTNGGVWNEVYGNSTLEMEYFFSNSKNQQCITTSRKPLKSFHKWPWEVFLLYPSGLHSHLHICQGTQQSASVVVSCRAGILSTPAFLGRAAAWPLRTGLHSKEGGWERRKEEEKEKKRETYTDWQRDTEKREKRDRDTERDRDSEGVRGMPGSPPLSDNVWWGSGQLRDQSSRS